MKEQESIETPADLHEQQSHKRQPIEKKRKIRKEKVQHHVIDFSDLRNIDTKKLTRQQRAKVQKVKNREAAQKSRDTHKQYVSKLQSEVREFRELRQNSRNICWRCKMQLQSNQNYHKTSQIFINSGHQQAPLTLSHQSLNNILQLPINSQKDFIQEDSFMRIQEEQNSYPYFKTGFFVLAFVLIICLSALYYKPHQSSRALMEIPGQNHQIQGLSTQTLRKMEEKLKDDSVNKTAVVKVQSIEEHGLIALNNDCIKSLMKIQTPSVPIQNSLTSYSDPNYSQKQGYTSQNEGILLCDLRMPKQYTPKLSEYRTPLVRLYLLGSEIKDLITNFNLMIPIMDNDNIQTNGIYQVLARIKEVNKVTNHNCLL